jgi:hypothetical protein
MDRGTANYLGSMCDLVSAGAAAYPLALASGVAFWSELAASASSYYADVVQGYIAGLRRPEQGAQILADLAARCKLYLQRSGDATERAILDFNERLAAVLRQRSEPASGGGQPLNEPVVALLRDVVNTVMKESWKAQEPGARVDLQALRRDVERLLEEIRRVEAAPSSPESARAS